MISDASMCGAPHRDRGAAGMPRPNAGNHPGFCRVSARSRWRAAVAARRYELTNGANVTNQLRIGRLRDDDAAAAPRTSKVTADRVAENEDAPTELPIEAEPRP